MPCGDYETLAKSMGFDCGQYDDKQKAAFAKQIKKAVEGGETPENAIRALMEAQSAERVNASGLPETVDGFDAEWTKSGNLIMKDVPVFLPTEKKGRKFTKAWIEGALKDGKKGEKDGYLPPMHVKHHGSGEEVVPAGMFRMKQIEQRTFKGRTRPMLIVDKIFTNPEVIEDVLADRLPYRSVEIFDATQEKIDGLSLLDHEAPFLELPITHVRDVKDAEVEDPQESVQPSTFSRDWSMVGCEADSPFVACFSRGERFAFLMEKPMGTEYRAVEFQKTPEEEQATAVAEPEAPATEEGVPDTPPAEGDAEAYAGEETPEEEALEHGGMTEGGAEPENLSGSVEAMVGSILSGSISVADMEALEKAIATRRGGAEEAAAPDQEREQIKETVKKDVEAAPPPPLASPGEAMQREDITEPEGQTEEVTDPEVTEPKTEEVTEPEVTGAAETDEEKARLMGRVDNLEAWKADRERDDAIREAVDEAMDSLDGRALGENPRERFEAFAREHGVPAFKAYAEELVKEHPPVSASRFAEDPEAFDFGRGLPDEVLVFQKDGPEAVERAAQHAGTYNALKERGMVSVSLERYLDINMNGLGGAK